MRTEARRFLAASAAFVMAGCASNLLDSAIEPAMVEVVGPEAVVLQGDQPVPWRVEFAPGRGERWCAQGAMNGDPQSVGDPCNEQFDPTQLGRTAFGVVSSNLDSTGRGLSWGSVAAEAHTVVAVFADGTRHQAQIADTDGGLRFWAIAYDLTPTRLEAHDEHGALLDSLTHPAAGSAR